MDGDKDKVGVAVRLLDNIGVVMIVHAAFATLLAMAPRREGTLGKLRLGPIAKALQERIPQKSPAMSAN